jgi:chemotaxis protein CheX
MNIGVRDIMNAKYINPILTAVQDVFQTMVGMDVTAGKPALNTAKMPAFEVNGRIGLSGTASGAICVSLPMDLSLKLASGMLEEEYSELDEDSIDALKEITNMIVGNAKSNFPDDGVVISVPDLVIGKNSDIYPTGLPIISIPFITENDKFIVDIAVKKSSQ